MRPSQNRNRILGFFLVVLVGASCLGCGAVWRTKAA